jgi:hypothetical protein
LKMSPHGARNKKRVTRAQRASIITLRSSVGRPRKGKEQQR